MASFVRVGEKWRAFIFKRGVRDTGTFESKAEAQKWATQRESEINAGRRVVGAHTMRDALEKYRDNETPKKRGKKWETTRLNRFIKKLEFIDRPITGVGSDDLARWRDARLKEVKAGSVLREMNVLSAVFETARREWKWVVANPLGDVKRPPAPPHRERLISDAERDAIVAKLGNNGKQRDVATGFLLSLETAMRAGEVFGLEWDRVNLTGRYVTLTMTKNGTSRHVPLSNRAVELLESMPSREGRVFTVTASSADALFRKARKRAGITGMVYHDSRHVACTRLAKRLNVLELARMIGHKNLKSLQIYFNETATEIAKKLD